MVCLVLLTTLAAFMTFAKCLPIDGNGIVEVARNSIDEEDENVVALPLDYIDLSQYGSALFGVPDNETTGKAVAEYTAALNINPEELGSYVEGDILIPRQMGRNGMSSLSSRWPKGIVPFEIRGDFGARDMGLIEQAIQEFHSKTCIRFIPRMAQSDYVSIVSGSSGCWSSVGRIGGKQEVNLQVPGCLTKKGTPMHELMHAVGFLHEQNRNERDSYVTIRFENIQPSAASNFDKASADKTTGFGVPYDYGSVMHYSANAFSSNGNPTIVPKQYGASTNMGQRDGFSALDIRKLNAMYNCGGSPQPVVVPGPAPMPSPVAPVGQVVPQRPPVPQGPPANVLTSFLGGLINGLGLGEEPSTEEPKK